MADEKPEQSLTSQLLPGLIDKVQHKSHLMIFDIGFGVPETVEFFTQQKCRLHFAGLPDLLNAVEKPVDDDVDEEALWHSAFSQVLDYPEDTRFHLCFFWDLFSCLNDAAVRGFCRALAPYIDQDTVGHAFAILNENSVLPEQEYGVMDNETFSLRPLQSPRSKTYPRPQARLASDAQLFTIGRSILRQGRLLEMTLSFDK